MKPEEVRKSYVVRSRVNKDVMDYVEQTGDMAEFIRNAIAFVREHRAQFNAWLRRR